jgi:hypothetical protein
MYRLVGDYLVLEETSCLSLTEEQHSFLSQYASEVHGYIHRYM